MNYHVRSVNWRDGMSLERSHFVHERFAIDELIRLATSVGSTCYGVAPVRADGPESLVFEKRVSDRQLKMRITRCLALAPDGTPIYIDSSLPLEGGGTPAVEGSYSIERDQTVLAVLECAGPRLVEAGDLAPGEPPRASWAFADHRLLFMDDTPTGSWSLLPLARFRIEGQDVSLDESFVPPCVSVGSHPSLRNRKDRLMRTLWSCREDAIQVVLTEIRAREHGSGAQGTAAEVFARGLADIAACSHSCLADQGSSLRPEDLVAEARLFLRRTRTLLDGFYTLQHASWGSYLRRAGRGVTDHVAFVTELETKLGHEIVRHPIGPPLADAMSLVEIVAGFPRELAGGGGADEITPPPRTDIYEYQQRTYHAVPFTSLAYTPMNQFHSLSIRGLQGIAGGQVLVWIKVDSEQRRVSETTRLGGPEERAYPAMATPTDAVDLRSDPDAILILMRLPSTPVTEVHIGSPVRDLDLSRLSTVPKQDVRVYHKSS